MNLSPILQFKNQITRSIAALRSALLADVLLTTIGCCDVADADAEFETVFDAGVFDVDGLIDEPAVDGPVVEVRAGPRGTPEVADRMRYIRALAVSLKTKS